MVGRVGFVGSNPQTAPQIEESFRDTLAILEPHFAQRAYLFGGRPAFADFGYGGSSTTRGRIRRRARSSIGTAPNLLAWIHRMLWPRAEGEFESWSNLAPTLMPLLERQVGRLFMPWTVANAAAIANGREEFSVELGGRTWTQKPQKYHARSLAALREKYRAIGGNRELDAILEASGCVAGLRG